MGIFGKGAKGPKTRQCWACRADVDVSNASPISGGLIAHHQEQHVLKGEQPSGGFVYTFACPSHGRPETSWNSEDKAAIAFGMHGMERHGAQNFY